MRRYSRQMAVKEIGKEGQLRLMESRVMIVGCGALGSMVAMQLAGAGVGTIGIADFDTIDVSNLQRQFFFHSDEAGQKKVAVLQKRINSLNPECTVRVYETLVGKKNGQDIFGDYDFIVDATDNQASKLSVETMSRECSKPCCIGGVSGFRGQVMIIPAGATGFGELFTEEKDGGVLPCEIEGVMGPAAALCASLQAMQVVKFITGISSQTHSEMIVFDLLDDSFQTFSCS